MVAALLALSLLCWTQGLRLLPMLVGLSLLAWSVGLMESANLWDYLMDPWLAAIALFQGAKAGSAVVWARLRPTAQVVGPASS